LRRSLSKQGYTALSIRNRVDVFRDLSRWLARRGVSLSELDDGQIERFAKYRRRCKRSAFRTPESLVSIVRYLRDERVLPPSEPEEDRADDTPFETLVSSYATYLTSERGLTPTTVGRYVKVARELLQPLMGNEPLAVDGIGTVDVTAFVLATAKRCSVGEAQNVVSALRSALRYLYVQGLLERDLAGAVPGVAGWSGSALPKAVEPEVIERLLRNCDRRRHAGRRDYAVLLLLSRLGLRRCEVAALELDDVDWAVGELLIRGKGQQQDRLPLPQDVGHALAMYIKRSRPPIDSRKVFTTVYAPQRPLQPGAVTGLVNARCDKLGLPPIGAHRLRHTAATQMLRRGASLDEIAQVLRHRHVSTTAIYAKVDRAALSELARPWPRGGL
jgi:site-specific recombinase XerD